MITRVKISNFKCLADFELPGHGQSLGNFVCLVGMNGAGKTTVLQAFDFLSQLMVGRMTEWMERRGWESGSLATYKTGRLGNSAAKTVHYLRQRPSVLIEFAVDVQLEDSAKLSWTGVYNRTEGRCTREEVWQEGMAAPILEFAERKLRIRNTEEERDYATGEMEFEGSIQSIYQFKEPLLAALKVTLLGLKSLELLTPSAMRRRSRKGADIGYGGEELSAFMDSLVSSERDSVRQLLAKFYPQVTSFGTSTTRGGWKKLWVREMFSGPINTHATHMNDGMLRVIAILAQAHSKHQVLLFDEIENGINPELVERLVDYLVGLKKQVIVTTHSPMILNYLEDKVARESVHFLYRTVEGFTKSVRFFDIPEVGAKLESLGPGEAFVDTNLTELSRRLSESGLAM